MRQLDSSYSVYDAKGKILGRFASTVARDLIAGKRVAVINAEGAVIVGSKRVIFDKYTTRLNLQEKQNPEHSPYWSRRSDMLVKLAIRGMLPKEKRTGADAYRRLMVFSGVPEQLNKVKPIEIKTKDVNTIYMPHVTIKELSRALGYNK
jgi:large subunit ribosomal protein L13